MYAFGSTPIRQIGISACWARRSTQPGIMQGLSRHFAGKRLDRTSSRRFLAASLAQLGQLDEARREAELYLVNNPYFTISHWVSSQPIRDEATRDHFVEGFRKASLPD